MIIQIVFILLIQLNSVYGFYLSSHVMNIPRNRLFVMVSTVDYPIKIRNVISKMTNSCQKAINDKLSRMMIELPPGVNFVSHLH